MAHVVAPPDLSARIDDYLTYLFDVMDDMLEVDADWDTWDDIEQLDFVIEWDIKRDRLGQLADWEKQGLLSRAQSQRYRKLLEVVDQRQPIIDRLLAE
ncbi:MAG TPA: hypothetical protein VH482_16405 [Thermomicrobiales bacterium]|jgi:hypothetical protein